MRFRLGEKYSGVSERRIQHVLDRSRRYQILKARFNNKVVLHPIRAKEVHTRHQCDLVDLRKWSVQDKGRTYRYILSIMDVFSRFVWSRPITCKTSATVANHLSSLYLEIGCPKVLQHDRGQEFAGAVDIFMDKLHVKVIRSSAYNPQSQGKIERMHQELKKQMMYELTELKKQV